MLDIKNRTMAAPNAQRLAYLAALVAIEAPTRANADAWCAKVPWDTVDAIRAALDEIGFDWLTASKEHKRIQREDRAARHAQIYGE